MAEEEATEGLSTTKKLAAGAAVGVALPAAVGVAKRLIGDSDEGDAPDDAERAKSEGRSAAGSRSTKRSARTSPRARSGGASKSKSSGSQRSSSTGSGRQRTKEQLYATAKRLKIDGRSRMNKEQLERAVAKARS